MRDGRTLVCYEAAARRVADVGDVPEPAQHHPSSGALADDPRAGTGSVTRSPFGPDRPHGAAPASTRLRPPRVRVSCRTAKTALSPNVVLARIGPPVVLASSRTTAVEIASARSPSRRTSSLTPPPAGIQTVSVTAVDGSRPPSATRPVRGHTARVRSHPGGGHHPGSPPPPTIPARS